MHFLRGVEQIEVERAKRRPEGGGGEGMIVEGVMVMLEW
jgi:hypothetical protein